MQEESSPSWTRGLRKWLHTAPETRDELLKLVQDSRKFLEPDTVAMLEGVLDLPATKVREVMTPRTALISLQEDDDLLDIIHVLIESAHSRFPVFSKDNEDTVVGVLLAKDLLPFLTERRTQKLDINVLMRQPLFVPESARSDQVLRMLKNTQSHLAIVIDEYGTTSGIVTLEDILEEIVGEIEDEHDEADQIAQFIQPDDQNAWIVQALTPIEHFNDLMNTHFSDEEVETMGGLLLQEIGLVNDLQGQIVELEGWNFQILEADSRTIHLIRAVRS
ncbi:CBS domain-containing protein [Acinetobacter qingfengensis]|uniref:Magnesium and cobalt efflux protein CorC n=1 Tax=Acinetobacter qingfengensis TaxID=1262585 RepID=A0A1E7R9Y1_9GAMM|nr:CBS domain-containing protein [Acinetobacter qingfengensis]KAA8733927.1 CBS domain-containing protein [Acinetobacter qingfengensis]OEY96154.1 magnesium/cobalt efflux protein [Acinetobacter qingfengensis]